MKQQKRNNVIHLKHYKPASTNNRLVSCETVLWSCFFSHGVAGVHKCHVQWETVPKFRGTELKSTASFCTLPRLRTAYKPWIKDLRISLMWIFFVVVFCKHQRKTVHNFEFKKLFCFPLNCLKSQLLLML